MLCVHKNLADLSQFPYQSLRSNTVILTSPPHEEALPRHTGDNQQQGLEVGPRTGNKSSGLEWDRKWSWIENNEPAEGRRRAPLFHLQPGSDWPFIFIIISSTVTWEPGCCVSCVHAVTDTRWPTGCHTLKEDTFHGFIVTSRNYFGQESRKVQLKHCHAHRQREGNVRTEALSPLSEEEEAIGLNC